MAGFYKYRISRSVSPPETPSYGVCSWIRRSATSSQFHPSMESTMESGEGLSGVSHKTGYVSPLRARTMKEYEQQITELQKENFNLKLRLYFLEEKMDKNFDGDTRQLHEVNIQLKIEAENLRKELEQKEKLLQDSRINQQKIEEKCEREFLQWKTQFEREHTLEQQELPKGIIKIQDKADTEVSISEICKEAFGLESCSPTQTDISESALSEVEAKEKQLEEAVTTLQKLDKLQQEELVDLREMAREKQSSLNNYVAKVKQLQEQQCVTESTCSKLPQDFIEKGDLSDGSSSQSTSSIQSISRMKSPDLIDMDLCTVCGDHTKKLLEKHMATMKKQSLKRDKTIQGLTEIVYKKSKEIERLKSSLAEKESIELVTSAIVKTIDIAVNNPNRYDKVKVAVQELSAFLEKTQTKLKTTSEKQWPENVIKSLEKHFMEWIISLHSNSKNCEEKDAEEMLKENESFVKEYNKSMRSLLITVKQKDTFIQDLYCKLEKVKDLIHETDNIVQLTGNLNTYKKNIEELEKRIKNLICNNSELKITSTELKKNYENTINQKDTELNEVLSFCKEAKENVRRLQEDLSDKEDQLLKCQKEVNELKEKCHVLQQQNSHSVLNQEKQFQLLNERLENAYSENDKIKHAYEELNIKFHNVIQEKDQQIEIANKGYKDLQNEYVRIQSLFAEKNNLCSQLKNELDNLAQKFCVAQQERMFQNAEIDKMKLHLENFKTTSENREKEIQHLKDLLQEKTLMAEGLIVELELKDSMTKQLEEELDASCANKTLSDGRQIQLNKNIVEKDIANMYSLKRHSLPVNLQSVEKLGAPALRCSKLMSQGLSNFGRSDNILELKEEIYFLVLRVEKLEQQIRDYDEGIGSKLSLLSGISGVFQDSTLNRTTKTWSVLHAHIEELADFLECLLRFDSDGQLDTSLLTPKNLARLKQYLLDSKELSQTLSASLLGNETAMMDGTLDIEPSRDIERIKEWLYTEKVVDEKTGMEIRKRQNDEQKGTLENIYHMNNLNNQDYGIAEQNWFQHISSDSDIWSEPDRAISMQRMGVNISMQARMSNSPRKITSPRCDPNKNSPESVNKDKKIKPSKSTRPNINENLKNQVAECHAALQNKVVECHNLVQTKEMLEKELSECQDELVSCREMLEELKTQLEEKDRDYQKLLKAKQQLEDEEKANHRSHEEVHRKLVGLSELVENMQLRLSEEENKVLTLSTERSHFAHQLENKVRENRQIQDWNLRLQKELEEKETICQQYQETKMKMQLLEENCAKLQVEMTEYSILRKNLANEITLLKKEVNRKDKKIKELIQLAQKLEESAVEKSIVHKNEQAENLKYISELEVEKIGFQQQLEVIREKLLETENNLQTELQTQNSMKNKEELLNEMKQLQKELAQNVSSNKKLRHRLEKLQKREYMQAVKDVGMHCNKDLSDSQHTASSLTEIKSDAPEVITVKNQMEIARDSNILPLQNYKTKWKSCENLGDKAMDFIHLINVNKPHILSETSIREEKTPCNITSMKIDGDRCRQASGSTEDSRCQRSHYTSPDLGIESDPAHEFEVVDVVRTNTDAADNEIAKENFDTLNLPSFASYQKRKISDILSHISLNKSQNDARQDLSNQWIDQMLYAVCHLQDYELLKKEIEESLILMKGIQARIKERILTISSKTSPIKSLEYSTLKELSHSCSNIELCLGKGWQIIACFWTTPMSKKYMESSGEEKDLVKENLLLSAELVAVKDQLAIQTKELQEAREKINTARNRKEKMERAISNQLVKTRQVLREAKGNLTESKKHKNSLETAIKSYPPIVKGNGQFSK